MSGISVAHDDVIFVDRVKSVTKTRWGRRLVQWLIGSSGSVAKDGVVMIDSARRAIVGIALKGFLLPTLVTSIVVFVVYLLYRAFSG